MLISEDAEREISEWLSSYLATFGALTFGGTGGLDPSRVATIGTAVITRASDVRGVGGALTTLEQSYLAGKLAGELGVNSVRRMSEAQLRNALDRTGIALDDFDRIRLSEANRQSARSISQRSGKAIQRTSLAIENANRSWRGDLEGGRLGQTAAAREVSRAGQISRLQREITAGIRLMGLENRRFIQTQAAQYFQEGQVAPVVSPRREPGKVKAQDEIVYKIPRQTAEFHCMRLHIDAAGTPVRYKLLDVMGNSNIGKKPPMWTFVIGPVHPFCYCILYRESIEPNPGPNKARAEARAGELERVREGQARGLKTGGARGTGRGGELFPSDRGTLTSQAGRRGRSRISPTGRGGPGAFRVTGPGAGEFGPRGGGVSGRGVEPATPRQLREGRRLQRELERLANQGSVAEEVTNFERRALAESLAGEDSCCAGRPESVPEEVEKALYVVETVYGDDSPLR